MTILDEIFAYKKREVKEAKRQVSEAELEVQVQVQIAPRGFRQALIDNPHEVALIAEVKKASPSEGLIREDFDAAGIANIYKNAGAACLSVLTDEKYFQGSAENLKLASKASGLPVLRKDFIFDEYQIVEARAWGADAILLIVAGLKQADLQRLYQFAKDLALDVLVEVHDRAETEIALELGADLIGVNNRDLRTFKTDLGISESLIPLIAPHAVAVSESALGKLEDIERVKAAGARAVLIGTAFTREANIHSKVLEVMGY